MSSLKETYFYKLERERRRYDLPPMTEEERKRAEDYVKTLQEKMREILNDPNRSDLQALRDFADLLFRMKLKDRKQTRALRRHRRQRLLAASKKGRVWRKRFGKWRLI